MSIACLAVFLLGNRFSVFSFRRERPVETTTLTDVWQAQKSEIFYQKGSVSELIQSSETSYSTYKTGDCKGKPAGYIGDASTQCRGYFVCQDDGRLDVFRCPEYTRFNNQLKLCDWHW